MSEKCPSCGGTGHITVDCPYCRHSEAFQFSQAPQPCPGCHDNGYMEDICPACGGTGSLEKEVV